MKKTVLTSFVILCLVSTMLLGCLTFNVQSVEVYGIIYIRSDGSIDPPISAIIRDGDLYTLTDDILTGGDGIEIERNNMTLDGAGYMLYGNGIGTGITLRGRSNVTITNIEVERFYRGISLIESSNNTLTGNNITNNDHYSITLYTSSNYNSIFGNNITNNALSGIYLDSSSYNSIYPNNFENNTKQVEIYIDTSSYANLWDNGTQGNYWSDYLEKYPDAEEIDGSGLWDTPYVIDENNQDNYPIIPEFSSSMILLLFMVSTLLAVILYRRKHSM